MYESDGQDQLIEVQGMPQHSAGAPMPMVFADDGRLVITYEMDSEKSEYAILRFIHPTAHYFGSPNDEALSGHPLYGRGLQSYKIFEVLQSSWIRRLIQMNQVHPMHQASNYNNALHFIFTFHDKTFECIARNIEIVTQAANDPDTIVQRIVQLWQGK